MANKKSWRPENWKPDYTIKILGDTQSDDLANYTDTIVISAYEAGADAMLEALERNADYYKAESFIKGHPGQNGWVVFIPDEAEDNG